MSRASNERQNEQYPCVILWTIKDNRGVSSWAQREPGWVGMCSCFDVFGKLGCHGCGGVPVTDSYSRPIDAHLARLEWLGEVPVGPVRIVQQH